MFSAATKSAHPSGSVNWIDDVFSTYLYTGNGSTQTITNGIDLSTKGGLVWTKLRNFSSTYSNTFNDTARGATKTLNSNLTDAQATSPAGNDFSSFNNNGFSLGAGYNESMNDSGGNYVSWTFRKQAKFFDVVTYTGNGAGSRNIAHSLASKPGFIAIKCTSNTSDWICWARVSDTQVALCQNETSGNTFSFNSTTGAQITSFSLAVNAATTTTFDPYWIIGGVDTQVNESGKTYVAYLFAHNAGGFGTAGTDNVISCGSFTTDGSGNATVNLGYEPQWILVKQTNTGAWNLYDTMRGWGRLTDQILRPNSSASEVTANTGSGEGWFTPTATGFSSSTVNILDASTTYIYIAIRRPMKPPTTGTSVFAMDTLGGASPNPPAFDAGFPVDLEFYRAYNGADDWSWGDRLRGAKYLLSNSTAAEASNSLITFDYQNGFFNSTAVSSTTIAWMFRRASTFFDVVCYTGNDTLNPRNHNLTVPPELIITKYRDMASDWYVVNYQSGIGYNGRLNTTVAFGNLGTSYPVTSTTFTPIADASGHTLVSYLFATVAGVSKVGAYTGTGTTQQINCGFSGGARFVLIKRTDSTGDWYVWDSARGIVSGNDPYLLLNSTAAEVTNTDYVDTYAAGFEITSTAPAAINANGGNYIYLAIA